MGVPAGKAAERTEAGRRRERRRRREKEKERGKVGGAMEIWVLLNIAMWGMCLFCGKGMVSE
jgi:hypothetical protein